MSRRHHQQQQHRRTLRFPHVIYPPQPMLTAPIFTPSCIPVRVVVVVVVVVRRWWLAGGVSAVVSILQRTLGHITVSHAVDIDDSHLDTDDDDSVGGGEVRSPHRVSTGGAGAGVGGDGGGRTGRASLQRHSMGGGGGGGGGGAGRASLRRPAPAPLSSSSTRTLNTHGSWLFAACTPTADAVAQRCLEVLYQVSLVVAGDEGVSGGSGGRLSGHSGQRSRKVYTPAARIFRRLARPDVVASVAQVHTVVTQPRCAVCARCLGCVCAACDALTPPRSRTCTRALSHSRCPCIACVGTLLLSRPPTPPPPSGYLLISRCICGLCAR
jgi:hypothetical protein